MHFVIWIEKKNDRLKIKKNKIYVLKHMPPIAIKIPLYSLFPICARDEKEDPITKSKSLAEISPYL